MRISDWSSDVCSSDLLHSNRADSIFGKLFVGYAFAEGWAHYVEEMMWDAGLGNGDPETHIGQLSNALLRNCRFLSAIGLHTKGMTVAESEKMFKDQCWQDEGNRSEEQTSELQSLMRNSYAVFCLKK